MEGGGGKGREVRGGGMRPLHLHKGQKLAAALDESRLADVNAVRMQR